MLSEIFSWKPSSTIFFQAYCLTQMAPWFSSLNIPTNSKKPKVKSYFNAVRICHSQIKTMSRAVSQGVNEDFKGLMENPIFFKIHLKFFHSPSKKQENKKTSCFCLLLFAVREVSSPLDQLLLFFHFPPSTGEMGCCMYSTDGDLA